MRSLRSRFFPRQSESTAVPTNSSTYSSTHATTGMDEPDCCFPWRGLVSSGPSRFRRKPRSTPKGRTAEAAMEVPPIALPRRWANPDLPCSQPMVESARKLSVHELSMVAAQRIGELQTELLLVASRASSLSFPLRSSRLDESEHGAEESQSSRSQTVSLSSLSSTSTWSFGCKGARRVERDEAGVDNFQEKASCSVGPWFMSDEEFQALPDWSDVEEDSEYNVQFGQDSEVWSVTTGASADLEGIGWTGAFGRSEEAEGDEVLI